jgi:DNA-3-methyladenine glycosylase II
MLNAIDTLSQDPIMRRLVDTYAPVSIGNQPLFSALVRAVISQQLAEAAAETIFSRLKSLAALTPEALLALDIDSIRACGISARKAESIQDISRAAQAGDLDYLTVIPYDDVLAKLLKLKGVGLWTAQMVLIFALGREDVWPDNDAGLLKAARRLYNVQDPAGFIALGERFKPYRSHAALYLWCSLDTK